MRHRMISFTCILQIIVLFCLSGCTTPSVYRAVERNDKAGLQRLLHAGADVNARDIDGWTPLNHAIRYGSSDMAKLLIERGADINAKGPRMTPLIYAITYRKPDVASMLIDRGADLNTKNPKNGWPAIQTAIACDQISIASMLAQRGANINVPTPEGWTPLSMATPYGSDKIPKDQRRSLIKTFIKYGGDVNVVRPDDGGTPLHYACLFDFPELVKLMIGHGADVNAAKKDGWTPLHLAVGAASPEVVEMLLAAGADRYAKTNAGRTPHDVVNDNKTHGPVIAGLLRGYIKPELADSFTTVSTLPPAGAQKLAGANRTALVVGNSAYTPDAGGALKNPVNDARDIAHALQKLQFKVILVLDADLEKMRGSIAQFGDLLQQRKGVGLFYFAGHGVQVEGRNYLIPTDATDLRESNIPYRALQADEILAEMRTARAELSMLILDACRNNPLPRAFRSGGQRGLAMMTPPPGSIVMFAAGRNQVASDGNGRNGLFTQHLLANIQRPGVPVERVFKHIGRDVSRATRGRQQPELSLSFYDEFYFAAPR